MKAAVLALVLSLSLLPSALSDNSAGFRDVFGLVLPQEPPHIIEREKQCLVEVMLQEARSEGTEGMRAVLSVVHNRKMHPAFPNTYCKVVHQPMQFSYRNGTMPGKPLKTAYRRSERVAQGVAIGLAEKAVYGRFKPSVAPGVLWYTHHRVKPKWTGKMKKAAIIGSHVFYSKQDANKERKDA